MKRKGILEIFCFMLFFLFTYTSLSKIFDYPKYVSDLNRQTALAPIAGFLSVTIPAVELVIAGLLMFRGGRKSGLIGAVVLMFLFTAYVGYVMVFESKWPCSCGGLVRFLTWRQHLVFNLFFLGVAIWGLRLERLLAGEGGHDSNIEGRLFSKPKL